MLAVVELARAYVLLRLPYHNVEMAAKAAAVMEDTKPVVAMYCQQLVRPILAAAVAAVAACSRVAVLKLVQRVEVE